MININRAFCLIRGFVRYGLTKPLAGQSQKRWLRCLTHINPFKVTLNNRSRGELLCDLFEELGPIFVKFGQQISVHPDLFPADIIQGLSRLQDNVSAFSTDLAKQEIQKGLGRSVSELFQSFDDEPLASASIAQVHTAKLQTGEDVIVKIVRPGIGITIKQDIALMRFVARLIYRFASFGKRLRPVELVEEFEETILGELDLKKEAASAAQLRRNFENSKTMYVPYVCWPYLSSNVMVMERIYGVRVSDQKALIDSGVNLEKLAKNGVEIFFTQMLRDSFFHADMHPGNLFIDISDPENPRYLGVDFGIMGSLSDNDQYYLAKNLAAVFDQDYREVARLHVACGWVPRDTRIDQFEAAVRTVCEPLFQRPPEEISFGDVLLGLLQTARRFDMQMQPQLFLLQKTLVNIEGLGRRLYPELDVWKTARPIIESWLRDRYGVCESIKRFKNDLPQWVDDMRSLPALTKEVLEHKLANQAAAKSSSRRGGIYVLGLGVSMAVTVTLLSSLNPYVASIFSGLIYTGAWCLGRSR